MPTAPDQTVQQLRTAHAVLSESCGSTSENFRPFDVAGEGGLVETSLTPQQCLAVGHLAAGKSFRRAAELVNISPRTLYEWRKSPAFQARLKETCAEALDAVAMRTRDLLLRGTARLQSYLDTADFNQTLRLVSSKRIWEMAQVMPQFDTEVQAEVCPQKSGQ